jgi:hypothetical protein
MMRPVKLEKQSKNIQLITSYVSERFPRVPKSTIDIIIWEKTNYPFCSLKELIGEVANALKK